MSFGSFYAALSGLQANASRLSVIGNNLANLNTVGFKTSRVTFNDFFAGSAFNGAGNPAQVGLGTNIASIDPIFTQGSLQTTNILTDMSIQGRGFFVLQSADGLSYARAGNFSFNADGGLVSSGGEFVQGFTTKDANGNVVDSGALSNVTIPSGLIAPPKSTSNFFTSMNLNANYQEPFATTTAIYDSLGAVHNMTMTFTPTDTDADSINDAWTYEMTLDGGEVTGGTPGTPEVLDSGLVQFDSSGRLIAPAANVTVAIPGFTNGAAAQNIEWRLFDGTDGLLTGFAGTSAVTSTNQNGYGPGELRSLLIDQSGLISGIFSNGASLQLAKVALASFNNENGLLRNGQNTFVETSNSGSATIGAAATGGRGAVVSGALELSNVDITEEFTDLIVSQRGYQSNSRVITTADEVIQESLNLKR